MGKSKKSDRHLKIFYKEDKYPDKLWINKQIVIQLNITPACPLNCDFCYIKKRYSTQLDFKEIKFLWKNLRKYNKLYGLTYSVNITGGDIFFHTQIKKIMNFLSKEKSIVSIYPLINRIWDRECGNIINIGKSKIKRIQMNIDVVKDEDISWAAKEGYEVVVKYPLYKGTIKKKINKIYLLLSKFSNVYLAFDWIIPQTKEFAKYCYLNNVEEGINEVKKVIKIMQKKRINKNRILTDFCIIQREVYNKIFFCAVGFSGLTVMPDGSITVCSRYPFLNTGFNIKNFDLIEFFKKYNSLVSSTCLFENKYFSKYWSESENPKFWNK